MSYSYNYIADEQIPPILSFAVLPYLLPDTQTKSNHENLIWAIPVRYHNIQYTCMYILLCMMYVQETLDTNTAVESKGQSEPYVLLIGSYKDPRQAFLVVDCFVVCEIKNIGNVPLALLSAYFVFNVCYPKGLNNVYTFLEHALFNLKHKHITPTVGQFLAGIHATKT